MFPIKILKLFESHSEVTAPYPKRSVVAQSSSPDRQTWPEVERRSGLERRHQERRSQQQAIMLDTRKAQGRRRCAGRRQDDLPPQRYSLSVTG